jgi:aspartyl-tRNA(Asn)/glutamyl-tRNA(Gln) amidotransferase subunit C
MPPLVIKFDTSRCSRGGLEPGDEEFYAEQLSGILGHIDRLQELNTDAIPPTAQVVEVADCVQ